MKLILERDRLLKYAKLFQHVSEEGLFTVSEQSLTLRTIDPAHVTLLTLDIKPVGKDEVYECGKNMNNFGLRSDDLVQIISKFPSGSLVSMTLTNKSLIKIKCSGSCYQLKTVEIVHIDLPTPSIKGGKGSIQVEQSEFLTLLEQALIIDFNAKFQIGKKGIVLSCRSDKGEYTSRPIGDVVKEGPVSGVYSLEYLIPLVKEMRDFSMKFSNKTPLYVISNDKAVQIYLAPRTET
ncbi:MAG: proliferating cell nuclear antigen (pcna) [Cenarchaeum symbiont of Oopsacas minuta]|nr:proliferating cell nuclear antigen (pcna) [Cenarchaeum symbiont of Oopsacas minuta]